MFGNNYPVNSAMSQKTGDLVASWLHVMCCPDPIADSSVATPQPARHHYLPTRERQSLLRWWIDLRYDPGTDGHHSLHTSHFTTSSVILNTAYWFICTITLSYWECWGKFVDLRNRLLKTS